MHKPPKSPDAASGTFARGASNHHAGSSEAKHENRFAEVQRKSRAARALLEQNSAARAVEQHRRAEITRSEAAVGDRDLDHEVAARRSAATDAPARQPSTLEKAAAQLEAVSTRGEEPESTS